MDEIACNFKQYLIYCDTSKSLNVTVISCFIGNTVAFKICFRKNVMDIARNCNEISNFCSVHEHRITIKIDLLIKIS